MPRRESGGGHGVVVGRGGGCSSRAVLPSGLLRCVNCCCWYWWRLLLSLSCSNWLWLWWLYPVFVPQFAFLLPSIPKLRCRHHFRHHLKIRKETSKIYYWRYYCYYSICFQCDCWILMVLLSVDETSQQQLVLWKMPSARWR